MPVTFNCPCGKTLRVPDAHAGRRAKCPACGAIVDIPGPEPVLEVVEEAPAPPATAPGATAGATPFHKPVLDDDSYDGTTYTLAPESRKDDDADEAPRPKKGLPNFRKGGDNYS